MPSEAERTESRAAAPAVDAVSDLPLLSAILAAAAAVAWICPERATSVVLALLAGAATPPGLVLVRRNLLAGGADAMVAAEATARSAIKGSLVDAVSDAALQRMLAATIRESVTEALRDESFMLLFRDSLKAALQDRDLHQAAMQGAVGSLLKPFEKFRRPSAASASAG